MKGELVEVITKDGLELKGFFIDCKSDIAVLHSHGTAGDFYSHKFIEVEGQVLSANGISFLTANNRGHDVYADVRKHDGKNVEWTTVGGGFERFEDCIYDVGAWVNFLKKRGIRKVILQGHSLGPNKNVYYGHKTADNSIAGYIHLSPQNDAGLMKEALGEKKYFETEKKIKEMVESGKSLDLLPKDLSLVCPISPLAYSGYFIEGGVGNLFPYHNPDNGNWKLVSSIEVPQLLVFGESDPYIKPSISKAVEVFKSKTSNLKSFEAQIIKKSSHSFIGQEKELADIVFTWITKQEVSL